jgi:dolichol-phosphate mannosyltransferase
MEINNINKEKNFISAVVYVHNAKEYIGDFIKQIGTALHENFENFEIICVNDASADESAAKIRTAVIPSGTLSILNMSYYQGPEASMNAGRDLAIGDFVYEFDTPVIDYDTGLITEVYRRSLCGFDIVTARSRQTSFASGIFYGIFNKNAGLQYKLNTETFRLLSRRAINSILSMRKTIPYRKALYANCGLKMDTIIYACSMNHNAPKNPKRFNKDIDTAFTALVLFTNMSYKAARNLALFMMCATLAGLVYTAVIYIFKKPTAGFTTMMTVITASLSAVFALLAVIIKYLSIIVDLLYKKQNYVVESVEKIQ